MAIQLPLEQIPQYWNAIKFAALNVNPLIKPDMEAEYCRNLLNNISSGNYQVWVEEEEDGLHTIGITRVYKDIGDIAHLLIDVVYSFKPMRDKEAIINQLKLFAINIGCKYVTAIAGNGIAKNACENGGLSKIGEIYFGTIGG